MVTISHLASSGLGYQTNYWSDAGFNAEERQLQTSPGVGVNANISANVGVPSVNPNVPSNLTVVCARDLMPCSTRYDSKRICDESANKWGSARCREDDDCMDGRICSYWQWCQGTPTFTISNCTISIAANVSNTVVARPATTTLSTLLGGGTPRVSNATATTSQTTTTANQTGAATTTTAQAQAGTTGTTTTTTGLTQTGTTGTTASQTLAVDASVSVNTGPFPQSNTFTICNNTNPASNQPLCKDYLTRICIEKANFSCLSDLDCTLGRRCSKNKCTGIAKVTLNSQRICTNPKVGICNNEALPACKKDGGRVCNDKRNLSGPSVCKTNDDCTLGRTCTTGKCTGDSLITVVDCTGSLDVCKRASGVTPCTGGNGVNYCWDSLNTGTPGSCTAHNQCSIGRTCDGLTDQVKVGTCKGADLFKIISDGPCTGIVPN